MPDSGTLPQGRVAVVTVTYGRRWGYLSRVIERLLGDPLVGPIIVVDNAAIEPIAKAVADAGWSPRVSVATMGENAGSAKGYKVGIAQAIADPDVDFVFLLDDDNVPRPDALRVLLRAHRELGSDSSHALLALRPDRLEFVHAARGIKNVRVRSDSFLGFHVLEVPEKIGRKLRNLSTAAAPSPVPDAVCRVQYAPYGGLLLHRDLIARIGLPDEAFYLYSDDHEYTARIEAHGGQVWLCSAGVVEDIEKSWHLADSKVHPLFDLSASDFRIYYATRNRVHFETTRFVSRPAVYAFNKWLYLSLNFGWSVLRAGELKARARRFKFVLGSAAQGARGELGVRETWS